MTPAPIATAAEAIDAIGGTKAMMALCGVGRTAVSNYRVWNRFPQQLHFIINRELERLGKKTSPNFFDRMMDVGSDQQKAG